MGENSKIEWTDHTFNPWIGCQKVSPACANCYAENETFVRVQRAKGRELWGPNSEHHITSEENWAKPLRWNEDAKAARERRRVFCASLADVFEDRSDLELPRARLFRLINNTGHLDWLLLTKRPENIMRLVAQVRDNVGEGRELASSWCNGYPPRNVWIGTTVETQEQADKRIPELLKIPAKVRFLSCEPLLARIDLRHVQHNREVEIDALTGDHGVIRPLRGQSDAKIHWVICGGESGPNARPMHPDWARSLRDQCAAAGVRFLFKQWGEWMPVAAPTVGYENERLIMSTAGEIFREQSWSDVISTKGYMWGFEKWGKKRSGRLLDGVEWNQVPDVK